MRQTRIFKELGPGLIRVELSILLRQTDVIPDYIPGLVQVAVCIIRTLHIQCRNVVAVNQHDGRFAAFPDFAQKISDKSIHLMRFVYVVFVLPLGFFVVRRYRGIRILKYLLRRVTAVSLHGNDVHKRRIFRIGQDVHDVTGHGFILCPSGRRQFDIIHVFRRGEAVKTQVRIYFVSVVEQRPMIVHRIGGVSTVLQHVGHAFQGFLSELPLIRIFSRTKELRTDSRQHLELRICGTCTASRHLKPTGSVVFH